MQLENRSVENLRKKKAEKEELNGRVKSEIKLVETEKKVKRNRGM